MKEENRGLNDDDDLRAHSHSSDQPRRGCTHATNTLTTETALLTRAKVKVLGEDGSTGALHVLRLMRLPPCLAWGGGNQEDLPVPRGSGTVSCFNYRFAIFPYNPF
ncbi:hypothetical protein RRG08_054687 [Elysia crispata]|uniref:Uncharacterized protein n=1 Tax=Elysia crispata TaxID=231223 RepID=A0AAE1B339_9GAST|nr:hypothetical protein RRG08_054687 [Elysia crispata]